MKSLIAILLSVGSLYGANLKAGIGRVEITPAGPIWMSGYAARTHPSDGVLTRLWARALAIESGPGARIVIVSTDVVGVPRAVSEQVAARVEKEYGLKRSQWLINASHTHTGPVVWPNLENLTVFPAAEQEKLLVYQRRFIDAVVAAIGGAIGDLAPATLEYGEGSAAFAINRRQAAPTGVKIGVNPEGPVDHVVPVLKITGAGPDHPFMAHVPESRYLKAAFCRVE